MKITFYGASQCVTGSLTLVEASGKRILIDCGLEQGNDAKRGHHFPFKANQIDAVILTHAHIDHCGKLPYLYKLGYRGPVFCTEATEKLCRIMLIDSARIQEADTAWQTKKAIRKGLKEVKSLYTEEDALGILQYFVGLSYNSPCSIVHGLEFCLHDAGHMLGSAFVEVMAESKKIIFSGDIGNQNQPIINDPSNMTKADYVIMESTYGDRYHLQAPDIQESENQLKEIITSTFANKGKVIIPSFSVGRTQEVLYLLSHIIPALDFEVPVFLDSPLSVKATSVFEDCVFGYYDKEAMELIKRGGNPLSFPSLINITKAEDSIALNSRDDSCIIISSSGMCEAGRIRHHLKHNLYKSDCTVVFTGYQAQGTLGRSILDGKKMVSILGEKIAVRARITKLEGLSAHADRSALDKWISDFEPKARKVFVIHGEKEITISYAKHLSSDLGIDAISPSYGESFTI